MKTVRVKMQKNANEKVRSEAKESQKRIDAFAKIYNRKKVWKPSRDATMNTFCSLQNELFQRNVLTLIELAVYPVLCSNADFKRQSFKQLSLENIAKKTGLSVPSVIKAINSLCDKTTYNEHGEKVNLLKREKHTEGQRTFWKYEPWFIRQELIEQFTGGQFFFYSYLIESGLWRKLDIRAKALYLVLRSVSKFDFQEYCDVEGIAYYEGGAEIIYRERKWEVCRMSIRSLCSMIAMSDSNISKVVKQLIDFRLIDEIEDGFIVYQVPMIE